MKKMLALFTVIVVGGPTAMAFQKPDAGTPLAEARQRCETMSERAKKDGVKTLVIGFEGLASYDAAAAMAAYRMNDGLRLGRKAEVTIPPGFAGFMTRGFVVPVVREHGRKIDVLIFPNGAVGSDSASVPETCALAWMRGGADRRLVVAGHSFGGHAAFQLVARLQYRRVKVDGVFTMDPRPKSGGPVTWSKPSNVRVWHNFYQKYGGLSGYPVPGAKNTNLTGRATHVTIPAMPVVRSAFRLYLK